MKKIVAFLLVLNTVFAGEEENGICMRTNVVVNGHFMAHLGEVVHYRINPRKRSSGVRMRAVAVSNIVPLFKSIIEAKLGRTVLKSTLLLADRRVKPDKILTCEDNAHTFTLYCAIEGDLPNISGITWFQKLG